MTSDTYMAGRQRYGRPQAMLWSDTPGEVVNNQYVPVGFEVGADTTQTSANGQFLVLSDHNRSPMNMVNNRIEQRTRMANGMMRSYHIADKLNISVSWNMLPSRSYSTRPDFNISTGLSADANVLNTEFTADGGAGGVDMLNWYENHTGPFWVFLSYDKHTNFGDDDAAYGNLAQYSQVVQMYLSAFDYSVITRGQSNFDMWNISLTLEEV